MSSHQNHEPTWRKYIDEHSRRSEAVIRDKGMSVWSLVRYLRVYKGDKDRVLAGYHGELTSEELEAALAYYWVNPEAIDWKLKQISRDEDGNWQFGRAAFGGAPSKETGERSWLKYIDEHSPRNVPVIRDKGFSVWSVVGYYKACGGDEKQVLEDYGGYLTGAELDAALAYYWADPIPIDEKLEEIST